MALFSPGKSGGFEVAYGYKGKGVLIHTITEGNGMPLANRTTAANGSERREIQQHKGLGEPKDSNVL